MAKRKHFVVRGDEYGLLTVVEETKPSQWKKYKIRNVLCLCSCGNQAIVRLEYLISGHTKSCGCLKSAAASIAKTTHGQSGTRLHGIWNGMLNRCRNKNVKSYKHYGAQGVTVSDEWREFESFMKWALSNGYREDLTIERINPFGNYEPENCCWIPKSEQGKNRRDRVASR